MVGTAVVLTGSVTSRMGQAGVVAQFCRLGDRTGVLARDEDQALELGDKRAVLVEDAGVDLDGATVLLGLGFPLLEHLGLHEQRVAVEDGGRMRELLGRKPEGEAS